MSASGRNIAFTVILSTSRLSFPHSGQCEGETAGAGFTVQQSMLHPFRSRPIRSKH